MRRALLALLLTTVVLPLQATPAAAQGEPRGIDVARYQHPDGAVIDWRAVRAAGVSFVYVKAVEGTTYVNPYYADDVARARSAGLATGAYHFARPALPLTTALDQANAFVRTLGDQRRHLTLPPALDLESTGGLSRGDLTAWAQLWMNEVRARTGRSPVLYSYPSYLNNAVHGPALHHAKLWIATYRSAVAQPIAGGWPAWTVWQTSASGRYPGIAAAVDTNLFAGTDAELAQLADGTQPSTWPSQPPSAPVGVSLTPRTRGTLTLRWLPGSDGGLRTSGWRAVLNDGQVISLPPTGTAAVLTGLNPQIAYTAALLAVNAKGPGDEGRSNTVQPLGPTTLTLHAPTTRYGGQARVTGQLLTPGAAVAGHPVQVQQRLGSTWSTVATRTTAADGTWAWTATVTANRVVRAVYAGQDGYAPRTTGAVLSAVAPLVSVSAPTRVLPDRPWNVAAAVDPAERRTVRLLVVIGGRFVAVDSATTDTRGVVHLTWPHALAGNRTARVEVGPSATTIGTFRRVDVLVR